MRRNARIVTWGWVGLPWGWVGPTWGWIATWGWVGLTWGWVGLLLAGCGLGPDAADPGAGANPPAAAPTTPARVGPPGTPDPDALTDFSCGPDRRDGWSAVGTLTNDTRTRSDFLVLAVLAGPEDGPARGLRQLVPDLAPGAAYELRLRGLPAPVGDETCQVQVVRR